MAKEYIFKLDYALYNEENGEAVFKPKVVCELIRCGECKHHEVCKNGVNGWCNEHEHPTDVTYFCADGERKQEQ